VLKIITLAIAFACSTLIILFSLNEFGFDRFHHDYNFIFRVLQRNTHEAYSGNRLSNRIPFEVFTALQSRSADSMMISRIKVMDQLSIITDNQHMHDQKIHAADPGIATIFSFDVLVGSIDRFQQEERTAMLSASSAHHYFGTIHATGKKLKVYTSGDTVLFSVAAVYKDYPRNSHEEFNTFLRFDSSSIQSLRFNPHDAGVYAKVIHGNVGRVEGALNDQLSPDELVYEFQPVSEIYFGPRVLGEDAIHGDRYSMLILICITSLILFLALASFINLTTLTLPHRSKELAVKKLAGTSQLNLLLAFGKESFAIVGVSLLLGVLFLLITSELIEPILSISIISMLLRGNMLLIMILTGLFLGLGIGPLFMVITFTHASPIRLLSSEAITFPRFKKVIIFLQLGISIFLIVSSRVMKRQVNYSLVKEPGRNYDQVVYLNYPKDLTPDGLRTLRVNWKNIHANIVDVMATSHLPDQLSSKELTTEFYFMTVDPAFKDFFDLKMVEGNWFKANDGDSIVVVNEKGKEILGCNNLNVIGVFSDMGGQYNQPEKPIKINIGSHVTYNFLCVRVLEVDIRKTINYLSAYFEQKNTIFFVNKRFEEWLIYQDRLNALSEILAILSGLLSCCAIYGLSVSIVRDKLKQIAIHKLCGANTLTITHLLAKEFTRQMLLAILIFGPFTYIVVNELLRGFVYSTHLSWSDPLFPLMYCSVIITTLCGFQAMNLNRTDLSAALKG
jgi:putative ABC transport system permease protein